MGGAPEAAARSARTKKGPSVKRQGRQADPDPLTGSAEGFDRIRTDARVDELPPEARGAIDRMLAEDGCTYQRIADALGKMGFAIKPSAVGRHYIGFELDPDYYSAANARLERAKAQVMFDI